MVKILSIFNNKGGVGKTTIANIIKDYLKNDLKILLIDLDPQMNLTYSILKENFDDYLKDLNISNNMIIGNNICSKLLQLMNMQIKFEINPMKKDGIDLIPGHPDLSIIIKHMDVELLDKDANLNYCKSIKYNKTGNYDLVIIDLAPDMYVLNQIALLSSDYLLMPCTLDYYCCISFKMVYHKIFSNTSYYSKMSSNLKIIGFVPNMVSYINDTHISEEDGEKIDRLEQYFKEYLSEFTIDSSYYKVILGRYDTISEKENNGQREDLADWIKSIF